MAKLALQTAVSVAPSSATINHSTQLLLMGSCFSDSIATHMKDCGLNAAANPFGTLYNPLSIAECVKRAIEGKIMTEDDVVFYNGMWHSWLHHGSFSNTDKKICMADCNNSIQKVHRLLEHPTTIIFTFGTSYVYRFGGRVVANCHKLPAKLFVRSLLSVEDIVSVWQPLLERLLSKGHTVLFTVSPIRHLADGAHGNQVSKATLLLSLEQLSTIGTAPTVAASSPKVLYFPAYEIVLDELRDYRFYGDDMVHPSPLAERIVWKRFQETFMDATTIATCEKYMHYNQLLRHRPIHPNSPEFEKYNQNIMRFKDELNIK